MKLLVNEDELASCVACGLCLPHCPTYRVTGEESASPRGRIAAMRLVHSGGAAPDAKFVEVMDACVQCRGCEAACPSAVPFGRLMAGTRETLAAARRQHYQPWYRRAAYRALEHHRLLLAGSTAVALAQRVRAVPARLGLPRIALRREPLRSDDTAAPDAWFFPGCVMDAWMRPAHAATLRIMRSTGASVALPAAGGAPCCGALQEHAGLGDDARRLARRVIDAFPGDAPVVVNAAGCGAMLKDYGHLLGTAAAEAFSSRVLDVHEWLAPKLDTLPAAVRRAPETVAVQDPCHLRHVQRAHLPVRAVLAAYVERLVELDDEGLCCGAGGAYAALQPELAGAIRERKVAAIRRSGATVVASGNPGCAMHLAAAGLIVVHPLELVDAAIFVR